jgi:hypothetical protein
MTMPVWKQNLVHFGRLLAHPRLWRFLVRPLTRYVLAWIAVLGGGGFGLYEAWTCFDRPGRADGNDGHITIDFGGQYLLGRMIVRGHGRHLYERDYHRAVLSEAYPRENGYPNAERTDVEMLFGAMMGPNSPAGERVGACLAPLSGADALHAAALATANPREVGGPLYPPVHALLYAPLALLKPQWAYHLSQVFNLLCAFAAGGELALLSRGRVWWPVAAGAVMLYPGYSGSIALAQNATPTLAVLVCGWVLIARGRGGAGGVAWGLLAFKPVWALAFLLVPVLTRRWRTCVAMALTGTGLALVTIPLVGLQSWKDWLAVGREATVTYRYDANWIPLSRDLLGIPRRWLDFQADWTVRRDNVVATWTGWALLGTVLALTVALAVWRPRQARAVTGPPGAYLLLGAWLCCFHFMYYDVLLSALPVFLLFTEPARYLEPILFAVARVSGTTSDPALLRYYRPGFSADLPPPAPTLAPRAGHLWVINRLVPTAVVFLTTTSYVFPVIGLGIHGFAYDTTCLLGIWLWCGWQWLREPAGQRPPALRPGSADGQSLRSLDLARQPGQAAASPL